jgi:hypothetical protein
MGTRADFYIGRGTKAEWLGSVAFDGYPEGLSGRLLKADTERKFRNAVTAELSDRDDATTPEQGWPWPWEDSRTTDFAYAFDGKVWVSGFGSRWLTVPARKRYDRDDLAPDLPKDAEFPNMKERANVQVGGKRSGMMVITPRPDGGFSVR